MELYKKADRGDIKNNNYQLWVVIDNGNKGEIIYIPYGGIGIREHMFHGK